MINVHAEVERNIKTVTVKKHNRLYKILSRPNSTVGTAFYLIIEKSSF
jgi:hypothetical protein